MMIMMPIWSVGGADSVLYVCAIRAWTLKGIFERQISSTTVDSFRSIISNINISPVPKPLIVHVDGDGVDEG